MTTRTQRDKEKKQQEEFQAILRRLLLEEDNKYCADCDAKGPRWASWNIGVFLCIRCAGIHRNLGVHISKVKSVNLDSWTEKQIASIDSLGNRICRQVYEANLPESFRRPQTDSPLEHFIRAKYEHKKYTDKEMEKKLLAKTPVLRSEPEKEKKKKPSSQEKSVTLQKLAKVPAPNQSPSRAQPAAIDASAFQQTKAPPVVNSAPTTPPKIQQSSMDDLLGLDTPKASNTDDLFGLSTPQSGASLAPAPQLVASASAPSLTSLVPQSAPNGVANDTDLFGPASDTTAGPSSTQPGQTSKESILALFGSQPATKQQMYNVPGGLYIPSQQPNQPQQMMMNQQQPQGYPQGMMGMQATQQQQGIMGMPAAQQQGMMGMQSTQQQQGMMGRPAAHQQGMMGMQSTQQQQGMMGRPAAQQQGLMGMPATQQQGMMGMSAAQQQQAMMGANMGYANAVQRQQAYLQQFQNQQGNFSKPPTTSIASANSGPSGQQSPPAFPTHQSTNTMHMQQPYMHMQPQQQQLADTSTLWPQHMYNHGKPLNNQQAYSQQSMNNQQVFGQQSMRNQQVYGHQPMNNQQGQSSLAPQQFVSSKQGMASPVDLMQISSAQPGRGGVTSQFMHMHQPDVNQVQAQMQNMKVGSQPGTNAGQMNGPAGQQMNGPAGTNGQLPQQQPSWNAGMFPSMQQQQAAQGVPVQGGMGWGGNMGGGQTLSSQLWK